MAKRNKESDKNLARDMSLVFFILVFFWFMAGSQEFE